LQVYRLTCFKKWNFFIYIWKRSKIFRRNRV
jgi:hypothetical protein